MFHLTSLWYAVTVTVMIVVMTELPRHSAPSPTDTDPPELHRGTR